MSARSATRSRPNAHVLAQALAFDTPGSRLDVFARAHRGTIEAQLRRFGLARGGCVFELPQSGARRFDHRRGRPRRCRVNSINLGLWQSGAAHPLGCLRLRVGLRPSVFARPDGGGRDRAWERNLKPAGDWVASHSEWYDRAAQILFILGALAIALNLWRALGFSNLLLRGSRLLTQETRERREDLEARAARLNQRVAALTAEADAAAKRAEAASQRAGGIDVHALARAEFLESSHAPSGAARDSRSPWRQGRAPGRSWTGAGSAHRGRRQSRRVVARRGLSWIDAAQGVIGPGFIGLLAFDPSRLAAALGGPGRGAPAPWQMAAGRGQPPARKDADGELVVARLLSAGEHPASAPDPAVAAKLLEPLSATETALLAALAPLAAHSPRDAERFLNAYRFARCSKSPRPLMALMQAVAFADDDTQAAMLDAARQWIGRTDRHQRSAGVGRSRQGGARRQQWRDIDCRRARRGRNGPSVRPAGLSCAALRSS